MLFCSFIFKHAVRANAAHRITVLGHHAHCDELEEKPKKYPNLLHAHESSGFYVEYRVQGGQTRTDAT